MFVYTERSSRLVRTNHGAGASGSSARGVAFSRLFDPPDGSFLEDREILLIDP